MRMFSGAVIILFSAHTVLGFGMLDFLRAARQQEAQHLPRPLTSPVDAIVQVIQGELDSDENGEISIAEMEAYIDGWLNPAGTQPFTPRRYQIESKRYMLALANLIDVNGDRKITTADLRRAVAILVNNGGNLQIGRIIEIKYYIKSRRPSYSQGIEATKANDTFMEAIDSNEDGEASYDEMETIFSLWSFRWYNENALNSDIERADENGDGKLNKAEAVQFLTIMQFLALRKVVTYLEIYKLAGREIADEWANSGH